jgi:hypothetical protein
MNNKKTLELKFEEKKVVFTWIVDNEVPIFSKNKDYVNRYLEIKNYDDDIDLDS